MVKSDTTTTEPVRQPASRAPFSPRLARAALQRRSGLVLLAANAAVIPATVLLDWNVFDLVFLYWAENVVIGLLNVLRMIAAGIGAGPATLITNVASLFFLLPFFIVHYGGFCYGHLIFVLSLFADPGPAEQGTLATLTGLLQGPLGWSLALLALSHGYSFASNYIGRKEYRHVEMPALMVQPYGRIIVLHLTILLGALAAEWMGSPMGVLLVLIALKTIVDLAMHERERLKNAQGSFREGVVHD